MEDGALGQELLDPAGDLGNDLVVPGRPLDLRGALGTEAAGHLVEPAVDAELGVVVAVGQELRGQRGAREVGEPQIGFVGAAVVLEAAVGILDVVEPLALVDVLHRVGHVVADGLVELREVHQVDTDGLGELVVHLHLAVEVGTGLAEGEELVERVFGHVVHS